MDAIFQLTASRRGWRNCDQRIIETLNISTHSLTKRLTDWMVSGSLLSIFQLTASRRGWRMYHTNLSWILLFQLTASRRGWRSYRTGWDISRNFNSQPHEEADDMLTLTRQWSMHFNSQPHEEADKRQYGSTWIRKVFQLTASRRGWRRTVA